MKGRQLSAIHFVLAIASVFFSAFCFQVAFHPYLKNLVLSFLGKPKIFLYFGILGGFLSLLFCFFLCLLYRHSFYRMEMEGGSLQITEALATEFVRRFFHKKIPALVEKTEVGFSGKKKMEITVYAKDKEYQKLFLGLHSLEKELRGELLQQMGYKGRCFITVAFI